MSLDPAAPSFEALLPGVVTLSVDAGAGSGLVVGADGAVLTAAHVVAAGDPLVRLSDGTELPGTVLSASTERDLALVQVQAEGMPCLGFRADPAGLGTEVWALGQPGGPGAGVSLSAGIVSGSRQHEGQGWLQTDAPVSPGNSGGPLVDGSGQVVGVVSWKVTGRGFEGVGFAVPAAAAQAWMAQAQDPPQGGVVGGSAPGGSGLTVARSPLGVLDGQGQRMDVADFAALVGQDSVADEIAKRRKQGKGSWIWTLAGAGILLGPGAYYGSFAGRAPPAAPQFRTALAGVAVSATAGGVSLGIGLKRWKRARTLDFKDYYSSKGLETLIAEHDPAD